jgi:tRNA(fMet)-specific endonuclease VapC
MKTLALDTNAYSGFKHGKAAVVDQLERAERILIPVPVLAELRIGLRGGTREALNIPL